MTSSGFSSAAAAGAASASAGGEGKGCAHGRSSAAAKEADVGVTSAPSLRRHDPVQVRRVCSRISARHAGPPEASGEHRRFAAGCNRRPGEARRGRRNRHYVLELSMRSTEYPELHACDFPRRTRPSFSRPAALRRRREARMFNSFGHLFRVTTWGESHGPALGCVVDGCPPGVPLDRGRRSSPGSTPAAPARAASPPSARRPTRSRSSPAPSRGGPPARRSRS